MAENKMKIIYLILMVSGLIFGGWAMISGNAMLWILCTPFYFQQLTIFLGGGVLDFGMCGS